MVKTQFVHARLKDYFLHQSRYTELEDPQHVPQLVRSMFLGI